jgi:hypothetical protein
MCDYNNPFSVDFISDYISISKAVFGGEIKYNTVLKETCALKDFKALMAFLSEFVKIQITDEQIITDTFCNGTICPAPSAATKVMQLDRPAIPLKQLVK